MKIELQKEKELPLLSRKRATFNITTDGATPSRKDLLKEVTKRLNVDEKLVVIKHIYSKFGYSDAKLIAHVYKNEIDMKKFEHRSLLDKHTGKKKGKQGTAAEENKE